MLFTHSLVFVYEASCLIDFTQIVPSAYISFLSPLPFVWVTNQGRVSLVAPFPESLLIYTKPNPMPLEVELLTPHLPFHLGHLSPALTVPCCTLWVAPTSDSGSLTSRDHAYSFSNPIEKQSIWHVRATSLHSRQWSEQIDESSFNQLGYLMTDSLSTHYI